MITFHIERDIKIHDSINLMSFNIKNGGEIYHRDKKKRKASVDHFLSSFKKHSNQEIICLQEVGGFARDLIDKTFSSYHQIKMDDIGTMILTKKKVIDHGKLEFVKTHNSCIWADIIVNFDTVRVYSVHLQSNQIKENEVTQLENVSQEYKKSLREVKGIFGKYRYHNKKRSEQVKILRSHIDNSPYPVIVCGDLNEPPQSYVYCQLADVLCDSFTERGNGIAATYAGKIPFLRIDYIFVDPYFEVLDHKLIKERYSDHYPVLGIIQQRNSN